MFINSSNPKFQNMLLYKPEILRYNRDLHELILPDNLSVIPLLTGNTNPLFFNAVKSLTAKYDDDKFYIFPLSPDFGIRNEDTLFVELSLNTLMDDYLAVFKNDEVITAENFVFTTEKNDWFICDDFISDLTYLFYRKDILDTEVVLSLFENITIKNERDILDYIESSYSYNAQTIKLFKQNIMPRMQFSS